MGVEIREVLTKKELWSWVRFPNKLYKDNEYFVPFLESDGHIELVKTLDKHTLVVDIGKANGTHNFCIVLLFAPSHNRIK